MLETLTRGFRTARERLRGVTELSDENVAEAGAMGFEPPKAIRVDTVLGKEGLYTK